MLGAEDYNLFFLGTKTVKNPVITDTDPVAIPTGEFFTVGRKRIT